MFGLALCLALVLAGCVSGRGSTSGLSGDDGPLEASVSDTTGAIVGLVVDSSLLPVPNATVHLEEPAASGAMASASTDVAGAFQFSMLEPASYRLSAGAAGFEDDAAIVRVLPGEVARVTLGLVEAASDRPHVLLYIRSGIFSCAWAVGVYGGGCGIEPPMGTTIYQHHYNVTQGHRAVVVETDWPDRNVAMDNWIWTKTRIEEEQWAYVGDGIGTPVLRKEFLPGQEPLRTQLFQNYQRFPASNESFVLRVDTFYDGAYQQTFNQTLYEACKLVLGYCVGVGVALDFKFDQYVTAFIHEAPASVKEYSAVSDG